MCEAISGLGHEVILFVADRGRTTADIFEFYGINELFKIHVVKVPLVKGKTPIYSIKASWIARKYNPDLVLGRSAQACALSALLGSSVVYDAHGPVWEISNLESMAYRLLYKNRNLKKMTTNSMALKEMYEKEELLPDCGITVAHNGSLVFSLEDKPENWPGRDDVLQIGYAGHLYPGRGIEIILDCSERLPEFDFHVMGGNQEDIDFWKSRITNSNLFFHGYIPHADIYKYRNNCDVLLAPYGVVNVSLAGGGGDQSRYMNPIKVIEYMSSRKAIICSDIPVLKELLDDHSAIFADPEDVGSWIKAISDLQNPALREKFAARAYRRFLGKLTWEERAKIIVKDMN